MPPHLSWVTWLLDRDVLVMKDVSYSCWNTCIRLNLGRHSSAGPEISHWFSFDREVNGEGDIGKGGSWKQPDDVEKKEKKMSCHSGSLIVIVGRA